MATTQEARAAFLRGLRESASTNARSYLEWYGGTIPEGWQIPDHIRQIADALDAIERGEIDRLAISMPPRHGKSETLSIRYPLRCLELRPEANVLVTGYNERFARKMGRRTRNMAADRGILAPDKFASDEWATRRGGIYMSRGVGSPPTGTGFSRIIVDDPIRRREDAESQVYREKAWDWYSEDLYSRLEPGGAMILVATRWHHDDVISRAIESEPGRFRVINLPAISDDGDALWPERYDLAALERIRSVNPTAFEALYQGNPTPREGSLFTGFDRVQIYSDTAPAMVRKVRAWDLASSTKGDYTVGVLMGVDENGRYWVLDVVRGRYTPDERDAIIRTVAELDGKQVTIRLPEDPGQAGVSQALALVRMLSGYKVIAEKVTGSKEMRADPAASQFNAGNMIILRREWAPLLISEMRTFPGGANDDQIDALSDAFNTLANAKKPTRQVAWNY